jgi:D-sedoheptulose 7-phosphate isomerase
MSYTVDYMAEAKNIIDKINYTAIDRLIEKIDGVRKSGGRLFFLGVGGSAANASHAVNDFRKIAQIESYTPGDNVSELTARVNDNGWDSVFIDWLKGSKLNKKDALFILSVGGGNQQKNVSVNLIKALQYAKEIGAGILGIVGRDGGFTATVADACVIVPTVNSSTVTPHTEAFQAVIWHLIVSHPLLRLSEMKWEAVK